MTKAFESKVIREGIVDTKAYRYIYKMFADHGEIRRIKIELLDTTAAIDGWETVKVIK